jgi:hypothetical protein
VKKSKRKREEKRSNPKRMIPTLKYVSNAKNEFGWGNVKEGIQQVERREKTRIDREEKIDQRKRFLPRRNSFTRGMTQMNRRNRKRPRRKCEEEKTKTNDPTESSPFRCSRADEGEKSTGLLRVVSLREKRWPIFLRSVQFGEDDVGESSLKIRMNLSLSLKWLEEEFRW